MILPIGSNCHLAEALRENGLRACAYPFDWISSSLESNLRVLRDVLELDVKDVPAFCEKFFHGGNLYFRNHDQEYTFENTKYKIAFPHDSPADIKDKYTRRFSRMVADVKSSDEVILAFVGRWEHFDNLLLEAMEIVRKHNPNVKLVVLNGFALPPADPNIKCLYVPFPDEKVAECKNDNWTYDQTVHKFNVRKALTPDVFKF